MMNNEHAGSAKAFARLLEIMDELREKCPWDRKQTFESLRPMTIEETYELAEAITDKSASKVEEELGDVLLHLVFYARIANETRLFSMQSVIDKLCNKLISRHPHIYNQAEGMHGLKQVMNDEDVKENWEKLKLKEGRSSVLSGVPSALPAVTKALRMQEKAAKVGFEWNTKSEVWNKVEEEIKELHEAEASGDSEKIKDEFGDVLFSLINYARFIPVDPDGALEGTNLKFKKRFQQLEEVAAEQGKQLADMTLEEMDNIWNQVKKHP